MFRKANRGVFELIDNLSKRNKKKGPLEEQKNSAPKVSGNIHNILGYSMYRVYLN